MRVASVEVSACADGKVAAKQPGLSCDLLAVSGGWSPVLHLFAQSGGTAQWNDDVHHVLHVAATGEDTGYYAEYLGSAEKLGRALAAEPVAVHSGCDRAHSAAALRQPGAARVRAQAVVSALALHPGASPAGQPEPRPQAHVPCTIDAAPSNERHTPLRAYGRRKIRLAHD